MTPHAATNGSPAGGIVLVRPSAFGDSLARELSTRYPGQRLRVHDTFLSAIAESARAGARCVVACVEASDARLDAAVAGLRTAVGREARIVLCCGAESEPQARRALRAGADTYVLHPLDGAELDEALGISRPVAWDKGRLVAAASPASMDELDHLGRVLSRLGRGSGELLTELAAVIRVALQARGAAVDLSGQVGRDGERFDEPVLTCPIADAHGTLGRIDVSARDRGAYTVADTDKLQHYARLAAHVLRAARQQRRWRRLAQTDELTGLMNRRAFHHALTQALAAATRNRSPVTVLLFDLDGFKHYNDDYGHEVGDGVLRTTADLFRKHSREHDLVARYGGDEFAVAFFDPQGPRVAGSRHPENVLPVLERFREALQSQVFDPLGAGGAGRLTISGGLAAFPWDGADADTLLRRADEALLAAKRAGKNRILLVGEPQAGA